MDKKLNSIVKLNATELSEQIHNGSLSCVEVMNAYLSHIKHINPKVNAIVGMRDEASLLQEAKEKDELLAQGIDQGFLHGFPMSVKDLAPVKGMRTSMGSPIFADWVPEHDQIHVERMREAGAIFIGKTNVSEFGLGSQSYNPVYGTTKSAYDTSKTAGGSSGGAAAAVAAKLVPVACGSDMMGSLRNPPAYNNVYGFRPSQGRIPFGPAGEVYYSQLGIEGTIGRNVKDIAMLLSIQAGYDARAPLSIKETGEQFRQDLAADFKGVKVGWLGNFSNRIEMEDGVLDLCEESLEVFEKLGCQVEAVDVDFDLNELWQSWLHLRNFNVAGLLAPFYHDPVQRELLKKEAVWEIESGLKLSAMDVYQASVIRSKWYAYVSSLYEQYDYLLLPSAQVFPFDSNCHWPQSINGKQMDTYHRWMEISIMGTLAGLPVMNVPVGFSDSDLPMGLQIMGPYQQDLSVLKLAYAYQNKTQWHEVEPSILLSKSELAIAD
ncbi:amidase [Vibrio sp. FJH11]